MVDFFTQKKDKYPKVAMNILGNLHQAKVIHENDDPLQVKEYLHQDNIFEIEVQVDNDVEGGIDTHNDCIYGKLVFLQVPSYQV